MEPGVPEAVTTTEDPVGRIVMRVRALWRPCTRTASRSQARTITSPAKLLSDSRVPRETVTVSSVSGGRTGLACCRPGVCAVSGAALSSATSAAVITHIVCLTPDRRAVPASPPPPQPVKGLSDSGSLHRLFGELRRPAEQLELPPPGLRQVAVQIHVCRIARQRLAALHDRAIDRLQVR